PTHQHNAQREARLNSLGRVHDKCAVPLSGNPPVWPRIYSVQTFADFGRTTETNLTGSEPSFGGQVKRRDSLSEERSGIEVVFPIRSPSEFQGSRGSALGKCRPISSADIRPSQAVPRPHRGRHRSL